MTDSQLKQDLRSGDDFTKKLGLEVKKLCDALEDLCRAIAEDYVKQRAVNEAILEALEWFKAEGYDYAVCEKLIAALREAIKP